MPQTNWASPPVGYEPGTRNGRRRRSKPKAKPKRTTDWVAATGIGGPPTTATIARNGRPRTKVTIPGHNKGVTPANAGKTYPPEPLTFHEAIALMAAIPQTMYERPWPVGIRNRALLMLLWRTGLRISEALDLAPRHVDFPGHRVTVLHGKGDRRRTVGIDTPGLVALQPWLIERSTLGVDLTAPLFCTVQNPGKGNRLNSAYVRQALHKYARRAGIQKRVHPHGLRHTIACELVDENFSLAHIQAQLGHTSIATTALYVRGMGKDEAFDRVAERVLAGGQVVQL